MSQGLAKEKIGPEAEPKRVRFVDSVAEIGRDAWNALAGTRNPFMRYEFLHALERTGCVGAESGWLPRHLVVVRGKQQACSSIVPLYEKTNSWGEYVFDWSWANAYQQHGLAYYPKFVTASPYTPSVGLRLPGTAAADMALVSEQIRLRAKTGGVSSWHVLFPTEEEVRLLRGRGMHIRLGTQFRWHNRGYRSFDDFLDSLASRKRKNLRKERSRVRDADIRFEITEGADISEAQWADFFLYYQTTYMQRGMSGYLNLAFFHAISETMPEQLLRLDRSHGRAGDLRDFLVCVPFDIAQDNGSAQDFRQRRNSGPNQRLQFPPFGEFVRRFAAVPQLDYIVLIHGHIIQAFGALTLPASQMIVAGVYDNSHQPTLKASAPVFFQRAKGLDKTVLQGIRGRIRIIKEAVGDSVAKPLIFDNQLVERFQVSLKRAFY